MKVKDPPSYGSRVRITVLKKTRNSEIIDEYCNADLPICPNVKEDREYIVEEDGEKPEGFCSEAYADIREDIMHLFFEGDFPRLKKKGTMIASCSDGFRPVIFLLERIR